MAFGIYAPVHTGSWGLPDFGITEWIGSKLGSGTNSQGGSELSMPYTAPAQLAAQQSLASQQNWAATQTPTPRYTPTSSSTSTNGQVLGTTDNPQPAGPSPEELYMNWLNQQYDSALSDLNNQQTALGESKASQEQQAQNLYDTSTQKLTSERDLALNTIKNQQSKSLEDIGTSLQQMWQQGNRLLGSRGASDSSAAGMYNYAVTKLGNKQRGDLMNAYADRMSLVNTTFQNNFSDLQTQYNNQILNISDWYRSAMQNIGSQRTALAGQKSEQILNYALQYLNQAKADLQNKQTSLQNWALQKAQTYDQAAKALGFQATNLPKAQPLGAGFNFSGSAQSPGMFGFGNTQGNDSLNWLQSLFNR